MWHVVLFTIFLLPDLLFVYMKDFLQGGAHYLHVNWPYVLIINAGQDSDIGVS